MKSPVGTAPVYSSLCTTMAFDAKRGMAVLVGPQGVTVPNIRGQSVWEWDGTVWQERPQSGQVPFLNAAANAFAYDTFRQECVLYGLEEGLVDGVFTDSLYPYPDYYRLIWRWNGEQWQADPPTPTVGVVYHIHHSMSFDSARNAMVGFGGLIENGDVATNYTYEILYQDEPAILKQPTIQVSFVGQQVQLSVLAAGAPPINYEWEKGTSPLSDTTNLTGCTSNTLTIHSAGAADTGVYQVVLSNICGGAVSQPINLAVSAGQMAIGISGGYIMITWTNPAASLQTAPAVTGPWMTINGASSPYPVNPLAASAFFRLSQ